MFLDEARIASGVHHPNVCEIYDLGDDQRTLYMAMEWVSGDSLARAPARGRPGRCASTRGWRPGSSPMRARGRTRPTSSKRHVGRAARRRSSGSLPAQRPAHGRRRREGRRLRRRQGARSAPRRDERRPAQGQAQVHGARADDGPGVDRRSDVFSLGCVLYEVTTGQRPFRGEGDHQVMHAVLNGIYAPPATLVPGYPEELGRIVHRALSSNPVASFPERRTHAFRARGVRRPRIARHAGERRAAPSHAPR